MRVQKTRKRQRQREHVKQNLRDNRQRDIEYYAQSEEKDQDNIFKNSIALEHNHENKNKTLKESSHEDMLIFGSKKVGTSNHVRKNSTIVNNKSVELDILNDPKKLDEFKKFQEYLKLKEQSDKIIVNKEDKVKEVIKEKEDKVKEEEDENSYEFEYEEDL